MSNEEIQKLIPEMLAEILLLRAKLYATNITLAGVQQKLYPEVTFPQIFQLYTNEYKSAINEYIQHKWFDTSFRDDIANNLLALSDELK